VYFRKEYAHSQEFSYQFIKINKLEMKDYVRIGALEFKDFTLSIE